MTLLWTDQIWFGKDILIKVKKHILIICIASYRQEFFLHS